MRSTLRRRLRRWRRTGARRVLLPGIAVLSITPSAFAANSWQPPRELSDAGSAPINLAASAGISPTGSAVVLWHSASGVEASVRNSGHNFGSPHAIAGSDLSMPDLKPKLAFDGTGAALAVWSYFQPHPRFVQDGYAVDYTFGLRVASRAASARMFGRAQTLTDKLDADPSADVAFDPSGNAVVIWTDEAGMHAAARRAGHRRFDRAQIISQTQADPQVAVGSSGDATAAWASGGAVRAAAANGLAFGSAKTLKIPGLGAAKPVIAVDGRSAVTAAWSNRGRVMAATCSASGHCGQAFALSPSGENATDPHVAVAADGTAVVAWKSDAGVSAVLRRGHRRFGGVTQLAKLDKDAKATNLAVTVGPKGDAGALWTVHTAGGDQVQASLRHGSTARFARASNLTPKIAGAGWADPEIVVDERGNAVAVWGALIDGHPSIQSSTFTPAG